VHHTVLHAAGHPCATSSIGVFNCAENTRMAMGELVSSSNLLVDEEVVVDIDQPVIWTTELHGASLTD
jgi:hypothetical protein